MAYQPYYQPIQPQQPMVQYPYNNFNGFVPPSQPPQDVLQQLKQPYQQAQMAVQGANMQATGDIIWVLNEVEAQGYPVALGNSVTLWDKSKPTIYVKSVSPQGVPSMRIVDYTERSVDSEEPKQEPHKCKCEKDYTKISDFTEYKEQTDKALKQLREQIDTLTAKQKKINELKEVLE